MHRALFDIRFSYNSSNFRPGLSENQSIAASFAKALAEEVGTAHSWRMTWVFDQAPNVACITDHSVMTGKPVLVVVHHADDHSWAFLDGGPFDAANALVVAMSEVIDRHPDLVEISYLLPGCSASRNAVGLPWTIHEDE